MGQEEAFVNMIRANEGIIFKITTVYTNNHQDQQDLYQEIVFQLWKGFGSFRKEAKPSTWMYRVALNTAITQLKKHKRKPDTAPVDQLVFKLSEQYDPGFEEKLKLLYASIRELNDLEKGLILLLLEGRKYEEIAAITGLSNSNVGTRLSRIKLKLKNKMVKEL